MKSVLSRVAFPLRPLPLAAVAAILPCLLAACDGHVVVHSTTPPPPPPPPVVWDESEPNDTAWLAPWFGSMYPGEEILVEGFSTASGDDPQDGLAFTGYGPCRIDVRLIVDDPWTDLDLWVYDADLDEFVAAFAMPYGDDTATFWLAGTTNFHLVVVPYAGASWWTLEVSASGSSYHPLVANELAPLDVPELLQGYTLDAAIEAEREAGDPRGDDDSMLEGRGTDAESTRRANADSTPRPHAESRPRR